MTESSDMVTTLEARCESLRRSAESGIRVKALQLQRGALRDADLRQLRADNVNLIEAELTGATLARALFTTCDFSRATLLEVDLAGATLRLCTLDGVRAVGLRGARARIEDSTAVGADLTGADLRDAKLTETSFVRASLRAARLDGAEGAGACLRGADLSGASLVGAQLDDADFRGADLTAADLTGGRFHGCDFRGAILDQVNWTDADCAGADFDTETEVAVPGDQTPLDASLVAAIEGALRDTSRPREVKALAETLRRAVQEQRVDVRAVAASMEPLLRILDEAPDDEPPEHWKAWLERLAQVQPPS